MHIVAYSAKNSQGCMEYSGVQFVIYSDMRKRFKKKKRCCGLCKPHKMHGMCRWKARELGALREFEKIKLDYRDFLGTGVGIIGWP